MLALKGRVEAIEGKVRVNRIKTEEIVSKIEPKEKEKPKKKLSDKAAQKLLDDGSDFTLLLPESLHTEFMESELVSKDLMGLVSGGVCRMVVTGKKSKEPRDLAVSLKIKW